LCQHRCLELVRHADVHLRQELVGELCRRRRVEHRDRPGAPGNSERRLHAFERDLELDEQDRGRLDQRRGPCDVADTEGTVGAGHNNDGVLAGRVESYVRDPGRMARVEAKVRDVDTFGDELGPDHLAEKVIAEQADHGCGHLLAGTGHGLVVALAPPGSW
jgi:hypothetical protein